MRYKMFCGLGSVYRHQTIHAFSSRSNNLFPPLDVRIVFSFLWKLLFPYPLRRYFIILLSIKNKESAYTVRHPWLLCKHEIGAVSLPVYSVLYLGREDVFSSSTPNDQRCLKGCYLKNDRMFPSHPIEIIAFPRHLTTLYIWYVLPSEQTLLSPVDVVYASGPWNQTHGLFVLLSVVSCSELYLPCNDWFGNSVQAVTKKMLVCKNTPRHKHIPHRVNPYL